MFARHPKIAKRWASKYGVSKNLPEHAKRKVARKTRRQVATAMRFKKTKKGYHRMPDGSLMKNSAMKK